MDLSGLSALAPGMAAEQERQLRIRQQQMALQQQRQQQAAQAAAARGLLPPQAQIPGQQPMPQMAPGQPSQPRMDPRSAMQPMAPAGGPQMGAGAPGAPSGAGAPQGAPAGSAGAPGQMTVEQLTQRIKAANPKIDDSTLLQAVAAAQHLLAPEEKLATQLLIASMRADLQKAEITRKAEQATETAKWHEKLADIRLEIAKMTESGKNTRLDKTEQGKGDRLDKTEAGKNERADKRLAGAQPRADYNQLATQLRQANSQITDLIRENGGMVPAPASKNRAKYDQLKARKDALFEKMVDARKKDPSLAPPSKAVTGDDAPAETTAEPAAKPAAAWTAPKGLPPAKGVEEGSVAKDKAGKIVAVVKDGAWAAPP